MTQELRREEMVSLCLGRRFAVILRQLEVGGWRRTKRVLGSLIMRAWTNRR